MLSRVGRAIRPVVDGRRRGAFCEVISARQPLRARGFGRTHRVHLVGGHRGLQLAPGRALRRHRGAPAASGRRSARPTCSARPSPARRPPTIARQAADLGLDLVMDPVMNWYPDREPSPSRFAGVSADDALRMCEALGVTSLTTIATASSDVPVAELAAHFGRVCDRAAGFGAQVHLEFMPFTVVRDLADGLGPRPRRRPAQRRAGVRHLALLPRRSGLRRAGPDTRRPDLLRPARRRAGRAAGLTARGDEPAAAARGRRAGPHRRRPGACTGSARCAGSARRSSTPSLRPCRWPRPPRSRWNGPGPS